MYAISSIKEIEGPEWMNAGVHERMTKSQRQVAPGGILDFLFFAVFFASSQSSQDTR